MDLESARQRAGVRRRMFEIDISGADLGEVRQAVLAYISSNAVGTTSVGRAFATTSEKDQEAFADWFTSTFEKIYRHREVMKAEEAHDA